MTQEYKMTVVTCPDCGGWIYAASERPGVIDTDDRRQITGWIKEGFAVTHETAEHVRGATTCDC